MGKPEIELLHVPDIDDEHRERRRHRARVAFAAEALDRHPGLATRACAEFGIDPANGIFPDGAIAKAAARYSELRQAADAWSAVLAVLGLDEPTGPKRAPGRCACGAVLPTSASAVRDRRRAPGVCAGCVAARRGAARA